MTFDPATVAAFVDGELDDLTARRIAREAENDPALAAEIARHRVLKARLTAHFAPIAEEEPPQRLRALLVDDQVDTSLADRREARRQEEHTSELQSLMRHSYSVFCLKKKNTDTQCMNKHHEYRSDK